MLKNIYAMLPVLPGLGYGDTQSVLMSMVFEMKNSSRKFTNETQH
jgi:hypothetical protein